MFMSTPNVRNDPRVTCALIAQAALSRLDDPQDRGPSATKEVYALTLARLLDAYRMDLPEARPHPAIGEVTPLEATTDDWPDPSSQKDVTDAVERSRLHLRPNLDRHQFAELVSKSVSDALMLAARVQVDEVDFAKTFLREFNTQLRA